MPSLLSPKEELEWTPMLKEEPRAQGSQEEAPSQQGLGQDKQAPDCSVKDIGSGNFAPMFPGYMQPPKNGYLDSQESWGGLKSILVLTSLSLHFTEGIQPECYVTLLASHTN